MPIVSLNQWNGNYNLQKKIVLNFSTPLKSRKIRCLPAGDFSSGLIVVVNLSEAFLRLVVRFALPTETFIYFLLPSTGGLY